MADSKLSELSTEQTTLVSGNRIYLSDGTDKWVDVDTLMLKTGDVTGGLDGVLQIAAGAVGTAELAGQAVTLAKQVNMDTDRIMMRQSSGTGSPEHVKISETDALGTPSSSDYILGQTVAGNLGYFTVGAVTGATKTVREVSGTTDTPTSADDIIWTSSASATTITIGDGFTAGDQLDFIQFGTGQVTFAPGGSVTLAKPASLQLKTEEQFAPATVTFITSTLAVLSGQLEPV